VIADLGKGEPFDAGQCHPSQARILVKKKLAEWRDGKLLVQLRPVHIAVAMNTLTLPGEDRKVSEEEVERRQAWFRSVVQGVLQSDTHGSDLGKILGYHLDEGMRVVGPRDTLNLMQALSFREQEGLREKLDWIRNNADPEPDDSTDNSWYDQDKEPPTSVSDEEIAAAWGGPWESPPDDRNEMCGSPLGVSSRLPRVRRGIIRSPCTVPKTSSPTRTATPASSSSLFPSRRWGARMR